MNSFGICLSIMVIFLSGVVPLFCGQKGDIEIPENASGIHIDGVITPDEWRQAARFTIDFEVSPGENVPAPVSTEVWISSDENALFAAFRCHDPEPEKIRARFRDRDLVWNDDFVNIVLDTFNDERRAFEFAVNPLGVQLDAINDEVNGSYDTSWDAIWDSAGRLTPEGWEVEIRIPFCQLRFPKGDGEKTWGLDLVRSWPRDLPHHLGLFPRDRGSNSYLSQLQKIHGFAHARIGRDLELIPTLTSANTRERPDFPEGGWETTESSVDAGITVDWGISPNTTLAAAVNPDFSQVEADAVQLDINTTFALYYPETRPFFLISADTFNTELPLLYTRTIAEPSVTLKWTGKSGPHTFGVFSAADDMTNIIIPGPEGSMMGHFEDQSLVSVGRYRMDFGSNSTAGVMITDREGAGGYFNRVFSGDLQYRISSSDHLWANMAFSSTRYNQEMVDYFGLDENTPGGHASDLGFEHSVRNWRAQISFQDSSAGFRADSGFMPMTDYREYSAVMSRYWWGDSESWYTRITASARFSYQEQASDSTLQDRHSNFSLSYSGPYTSNLTLSFSAGDRAYGGEIFPTDHWTLFSSIRPNEKLFFFLFINRGDWIDFSALQPAIRLNIGPTIEVNAGRHLNLSLSWDYTDLSRWEGRVYTARIAGLRSVYQFNLRSFFRIILQYVQLDRNAALSPETSSPRSKDLFTQLLFSYKLNARTVFFLGYSDRSLGAGDQELTRLNQSVFAKIGYSFLF